MITDVSDAADFAKLQGQLEPMFARILPDPMAPRTVIVVPSLSFDARELAKISGIHHYEERMLCLLMLLQLPRTQVIYVTSQPIHDGIVDYFLHLLPGIPGRHARRRLTMLACHDSSMIPLTEKILKRPRLIQRIQDAIQVPDSTHITCFNTTYLERDLALQLNAPLYACDPALTHWGTKSNGREVFRRAGIGFPRGKEHLSDEVELIDALTELKRKHPRMRRAVIKLNDGFSGEGNALFSFRDCPEDKGLQRWVKSQLPIKIRFEASSENWEEYRAKFAQMGGIAEQWIDGNEKRSPSVQCRINPLGKIEIISTHDQVLGEPSGQVFLGCTFPADKSYRMAIQEAGKQIGEILKAERVIGRFGVDFISVREETGWRHYAIEINLRKGGTTHPYLMLQFLTNGEYDEDTGQFYTPSRKPRYYYSSDNICSEDYIGLTPDDLVDIAVCNDLHFHGASQEGVAFHLMGALSEFGKFGAVCIGNTPKWAKAFYDRTVASLNEAVAR